MSECKSIRKDDVRVTAKQLGAKVGDMFVVLSAGESHNWETPCIYNNIGDVLIMKEDDDSLSPIFYNVTQGEDTVEEFACLVRYEKGKENAETPVDNIYDIALEYSHSFSTREFRFTKDSLKQFVEHIKGE